MGNHGTSANSSSHTESSWRLNELTNGDLYESRCQPLDMLQTIGVNNKGPSQRIINWANADTDGSANDHLAAYILHWKLKWIKGEKEQFMRTPKSSTTFETCMESPGFPVAEPVQQRFSCILLELSIYQPIPECLGVRSDSCLKSFTGL